MLDVLLQARDADLYESITDCGAGGLSSAVGEMGEKLGAQVDLEKVRLFPCFCLVTRTRESANGKSKDDLGRG